MRHVWPALSLQGSSEPWSPLDNSFGAVWQSPGALPQPPFDVQITPASGPALIAEYACRSHKLLACKMARHPVICIISKGAPFKTVIIQPPTVPPSVCIWTPTTCFLQVCYPSNQGRQVPHPCAVLAAASKVASGACHAKGDCRCPAPQQAASTCLSGHARPCTRPTAKSTDGSSELQTNKRGRPHDYFISCTMKCGRLAEQ